MKVFPLVALVLLGFGALFITFLVAPLAVLAIFYVGFSLHSSRVKPAPVPEPVPEPRWRTGVDPASDPDSGFDTEPEPVALLERRPRVTVVSHDDGAAALAPQAADAGSDNYPPASSASARADDPVSPERT
jgi:hypothetical protein